MSILQAIQAQSECMIVQGRILNKQSKEGVPGLRVDIFDKDFFTADDVLGSVTTKPNGEFRVRFSKANYQDFIFDRNPDLYFHVYQGEKMILNTEDAVLMNVTEHSDPIVLEVEIEEPTASQEDAIIHWNKVRGVAQFGGADFANLNKQESNLSISAAKEMAESDPAITYFIMITAPMEMTVRGEKQSMQQGDVLFFSGKPTYGSASGADAYEKERISYRQKENVAQFGGADWKNEVFRFKNMSVETAKEIAARNPEVTYFFRTHSTMWLTGRPGLHGWTEKGHFFDGDVVFFSGKPWYGSAPQSNAYEKIVEKFW